VFPHSRALDDEKELEEERRLAYVGITRAKRRLYLSHAWRRATWGAGQASVPSRFLIEIPPELMVGPQLGGAGEFEAEGPLDLDLVFGARRASRFGTPIKAGGGAWRQGSGRPGAPSQGTDFRPTRDLAAKREAFAEGARSGSLARPIDPWDGEDHSDQSEHRAREVPAQVRVPRPIVPGERQYRDGDRVRHIRWGDGIVVSSKLTRSDEEVIVAFRDPAVGRKTMLASLANLEITG
jgi:DNA helicase II / ATP-dependent DNA helicase PcrA